MLEYAATLEEPVSQYKTSDVSPGVMLRVRHNISHNVVKSATSVLLTTLAIARH